jgi:hypothetical protein
MLSARNIVELYVEQLNVKMIWNRSCMYVKGRYGLIGNIEEIFPEELKKTA